ncbi:acyltransferase family protein [Facklamia lactis]|uniref:acyltransferase family protein n=1 Tax=Facklamia lactis TaxID=2749967 RepID=UPI0018CF3672|nr:acyltransferase family protein [Facklamia lactis]MBG9979743.1 acyltransferase [Facklamia lactis]
MIRIKAFDGIKEFAILSIILYHLWPEVIPGGFLTVNTFLVLSGYFLTNKLRNQPLKEVASSVHKTISRVWFPLLWFLIFIVVGLLILNPIALKSLQLEILASLTFLNNFFQLASERSYFTDMANASPMTHLWYIAIYIQSFIIAIPVILIGDRWITSDKIKGIFWLLVFACTLYLNHLHYQPGQDPSNVYYGIQTRFASFAIGIAVAYLNTSLQAAINQYRYFVASWIYFLMSVGSFVMMVYLIFHVSDQEPITYQFWLPYYNVLASAFIIGANHRFNLVEDLIGHPLLAWLGQKSYSFYLWYYPIIVYSFSYLRNFQDKISLLKGATFLAIVVIASLFSYLIESKRMTYLFGTDFNFKQDWQDLINHFKPKPRFSALLARSIIYFGLLGTFIYGICYADNQKSLALFELEYGMYQTQPSPFSLYYPHDQKAKALRSELLAFDQEMETNFIQLASPGSLVDDTFKTDLGREMTQKISLQLLAAAADKKEDQTDEEKVRETLSEPSDDQEAKLEYIQSMDPEIVELLSEEEMLYAVELPVTLFGDSLAKLAGPVFETVFQEGSTYGYTSLQVWDSYDEFQDLLDQELVEETLIINLGTNAGYDLPGLTELIDMAGDREIYLVNTNSAVEHVEEVNEVIKECTKLYDNVHEIDWHSVSLDHPEYYGEDDIHLSLEGLDYYTATIVKALYENQ